MTSTNPVADHAAPAIDRGDAANPSKPSTKRLRASSETQEQAGEGLLRTATRRKTQTSRVASPTSGDVGDAAAQQPRQTKAAMVESLLTHEGGASLEALCEVTGWQAHTCRAFLTGLRKKGREVIRASDKDGKSIYLIAPDQSNAPAPATEQAETESN